jgi:peptidoglycan hydrolase-like protein with peptidoglycan-binding domain
VKRLTLAGILTAGMIAVSALTASGAANAAGTCTSYTYRVGDSATCVRYIQQMVNDYPFTGVATLSTDGSFGAKTKAGVQAVQRDAFSDVKLGAVKAITADGIVGPNTWKKLCTFYRGSAQYVDYPGRNTGIQAAKNAGCPGPWIH